MDDLYQIVYMSRACREIARSEIDLLADEASRLNAQVGVTGLLIYDGERFIQALEGAKDQVAAIMDRIEADRRHDSINYLNEGLIDHRQFGTWSMRFAYAPEGCCSNEFIDRVKADVDIVTDPYLRAAFIGFAVLSSRKPRGYMCRESGDVRLPDTG